MAVPKSRGSPASRAPPTPCAAARGGRAGPAWRRPTWPGQLRPAIAAPLAAALLAGAGGRSAAAVPPVSSTARRGSPRRPGPAHRRRAAPGRRRRAVSARGPCTGTGPSAPCAPSSDTAHRPPRVTSKRPPASSAGTSSGTAAVTSTCSAGGDHLGQPAPAPVVQLGEDVVQDQHRLVAVGPQQVVGGQPEGQRERPRLAVAGVAACAGSSPSRQHQVVAVRADQGHAAFELGGAQPPAGRPAAAPPARRDRSRRRRAGVAAVPSPAVGESRRATAGATVA